MFESRIVSIAQYIKMNKSENNVLDFVYQQEQQEIIRLSEQLLDMYQIEYDNATGPRALSKFFVKADLSAQKERYTSKVMHIAIMKEKLWMTHRLTNNLVMHGETINV